MVKVPIGAEVIIDLWNTEKKKGMVKYFDGSLELVPGISDFPLKKGDEALVINSHENLVKVIPINRYTEILDHEHFGEIDYEKLSALIFQILKEKEQQTGGILSEKELYEEFQKSPIKDLIKIKDLRKSIHDEDPVEIIKVKGTRYYCIKLSVQAHDFKKITEYIEETGSDYLTELKMASDLGWAPIRIKRLLNFLIDNDYCRIDESYRKGKRYYIIK